jgi:type IV pilus assembly protein PilE
MGKRVQQHGFTLVELMVVVAIIAILSGIGYPMYLQQVQKARRAEIPRMAMAVALAQEKMRGLATTNASFTTDLTSAALRLDPQAIQSDYYNIAIAAGAGGIATSFVITITAIGAQLSDSDCQTMTINHLGVKTAVNSSDADTTAACW